MASNLEINYKEITSKKEVDSQDYLEVMFITAEKLRESIDKATSKFIRNAKPEDVKLKEISIADGRICLSLDFNRVRSTLVKKGIPRNIKYVSRLTLLYEGPEDAQTIANEFWVE